MQTFKMTSNKFAQSILLATACTATSMAFAADPLANTTWQTYDDKSKKPAGVIKITESNGVLTGKLVNTSDADGKKYIGTTIIKNLKAKGKGKYAGGSIYDPENGKTYKLKATLKGNQLDVRGYIGVSLAGRTQTWKKR